MRSGRPIDGADIERSGKSKLEDWAGRCGRAKERNRRRDERQKKGTTDYSVIGTRCCDERYLR